MKPGSQAGGDCVFFFIVKDAKGNSVKSNTVTISMKEESGALKITQQPVNVTAAKGETAKVTISAITRTWYSDSWWEPDNDTYNAYWSFDGVTMEVYCEVKDANGNIATTQHLTIYSSE